MEEKSLALSLKDSLTEEITSVLCEFSEVSLDSIMEEGFLKEIPFISTAVSIYNIGKSIRERHHVAKLIVFLNEINKGTVDYKKRDEYKEKFKENPKFCSKELEYILVLIDRYITLDKPKLLARIYLAYLDGVIIWEELVMYAEVIDRFLLLDFVTLTSQTDRTIVYRNIGGESVLRLVALGLMTEVTETSPFVRHGDGSYGLTIETLSRTTSTNKVYKRTEFGEKLANILRE